MGGGPTSEVLRKIPAADWLRGLGAALILGVVASFALPLAGVVAAAVLGGVGAMVMPWRAAAANWKARPASPVPTAPTSAERFLRAVKTVGDFREQANRWYLSEQPMPANAWDVLKDSVLDWANAALRPDAAERAAAVLHAASPQGPSSDNRRNAGMLVASLLEFQRTLTNAEVL
jgi:hypothetical protein